MKSSFDKLWNNSSYFLTCLLAAIAFFSYLFFSKQNIPSEIAHSDKIGHIIVFFCLGFALFKAVSFSRVWQMAMLLSYGVAVECIQHYIPYRSGSFDDVVADSIGFALFYLITLSPTLRNMIKQP